MTIGRCFLGVDVGTAEVRAGLFDSSGRRLGSGSHPIRLWRPQEDYVEQSSADIWRACAEAVGRALTQADVAAEAVAGVGFDATCSLVVLDADDRPVTVSPTGVDEQNVMVWMDHRAIAEAEEINSGGHEVLTYVGGVISPEMQTPKLLWLKRNLPTTWERAARFLDLPDFLAYRATGVDLRSQCTTVCKWTYLGHEGEGGTWSDSYFRSIGLDDLVDERYRRIGTDVRPLGQRAGELTRTAAQELGLAPGTPVAVSIIDAHAGGIGLLGTPVDGRGPDEGDLDRRLALVAGTSSCHMALSPAPRFVAGVWGPYWSAMVPELWLTEGGQSASGALVDHIIFSHARGSELARRAQHQDATVYDLLNAELETLAADVPFQAELTAEVHVLPYFHGNRSPRADPTLRGAVSGLKLTDSVASLAVLYLATIQAIAHGTRHIIEAMNQSGYRIDTLVVTGGSSRNPVFLREHADVTGCRLVLPREPEAVLLGAAVLGAVAAGDHPSVLAAMTAMTETERLIDPAGGAVRAFHDRKYRVFRRMYDDQIAYRSLMSPTGGP